MAVLVLVQVALIAGEWEAGRSAGSAATLQPAPAPNTDLGRILDPATIIADPDVLTGRHVDYLYTGQSGYTPPYVPVRTFHVLGRWGEVLDAMPHLPPWAASWVWNPDVRRVDGRYVMWFTAPLKGTSLPTTGAMPRCIGWAVSKSPLGPFSPSPRPAICQVSRFGAIDARTMVAPGGQEWLYWKSDSNAVPNAHMKTVIWAQRLAPNGITREGRAVDLMDNSQPWEGALVEAPQMVYQGGHYYLFFSGNAGGSTLNGIGVATCRGPAGPCRNPGGPWLGTSPQSVSAGEESLFTQDGKTWVLYSPHRLFLTLMVSRVAFGAQGPYVAAFRHLPGVG